MVEGFGFTTRAPEGNEDSAILANHENVIYYTVTIDSEEEWDWDGPFPVENLETANIRQLDVFHSICLANGARPTYFVNHAVMSDNCSRDVILSIGEQESVELGMHIHPWNTPPILPGPVKARDSFIHNLPRELALEKLETTYDTFVENGVTPTSFRGGRYSCGPVVQEFLFDRGFRVDASICPFSKWADEGAPDYSERDLRPVVVGANAAGESLWEVPLSRAYSRRPFHFWRKLLRFIEDSPLANLRLVGLAGRLNLLRQLWLNFESESIAQMRQFIRLATNWKIPHLCFTVHSSSLAVGPGPYCRTENDRRRILTAVDEILRQLSLDPRFVAVTISELADRLDEEFKCVS